MTITAVLEIVVAGPVQVAEHHGALALKLALSEGALVRPARGCRWR